MSWFLKGMKQYADFSGRARRQEFWMYMLFYSIFGIILYGVAVIGMAMQSEGIILLGMGIYILYALALLLPTLAITVRRLHDTGRSGFWYFIGFVPLVGGIILLVFCCLDSENGNNQWGSNPKNSDSMIEAI
ncbi:DUF805 domain-containing protein [Rossellomorea marisflavi]|uniref:DUF805 domain-containing protein n=1 Tax=Rossellomorea TaxID=2837508 RepID=UPI001C4472E1|nr:DUF805 domain-containing protein [Rossellomorea marisflavi]MBV6685140.1 DUF805 domain-containing protein [Bacillus sp. JRC01]MDW4526775.1 DUF805 domain-containing protein [Rossellomorea marisflavi]UKS63501.1 DUF805 domain-containing protein [Rossellomorea marisflavi]WJV16857.1 DUF805 domain-containing protein [Rossellomorea marisflavi]